MSPVAKVIAQKLHSVYKFQTATCCF